VIKVSALRRDPPSSTTIILLLIGGYLAHAFRIAYVPWVFFLAAMCGLLLRQVDVLVDRMDEQAQRWEQEAEEKRRLREEREAEEQRATKRE
jgi:hypothetical protein